METGGYEPTPEEQFIQQLGLVNSADIDRAAELLSVYTDAIKEVLDTSKVIVPTERFVEDLGSDSLGVLEVLEILQEKLDVDLDTEAFDGVSTVGEAFQVVYKIVKANEDGGPGDGPESGDREPRNPVPSAPSGSVQKDLPQ